MIYLNNKRLGKRGKAITAYTSPEQRNVLGQSVSRAPSGSFVETASSGASLQASALSGSGANISDGYLTSMIQETPITLIKAFRDMYAYDSICGCAVDLWSELPFSNFSLYGCEEKKLEVYDSAIARLNMRTMLSQITRQYLVEGVFTSTLVFNQKAMQFIDQIAYPYETLTFDSVPLAGQDPIITTRLDASFDNFLNATGKEWDALRKLLPTKLLTALQSRNFVLDPISTIYLARKVFPNQPPVSYLKRCLPVYLLEKNMYRGTLFELSRRQRANVLVTAGDDMWEPTPQELQTLATLFQQCDLDPLGALLVTRNSVNVSEFRCLAGDTLIETKEGKVAIRDLIKHDPDSLEKDTCFPLDIDIKVANKEFAKAKFWWYRGETDIIRLTLSDGRHIDCTPTHKFPVKLSPGIISKYALQPADQIKGWLTTEDSENVRVIHVHKVGKAHVYDLTMDSSVPPVFMANGILTKNSGGDFYKWTDIYDTATSMKLKALGISDAFLSADSTYSNSESAIATFMENLSAYRDYTTFSLFTNKLFPLIAMASGFYKNKDETSADAKSGLKVVNDHTQLDIPKIRWAKRLTAGNDENLMDSLEKLSAKGVPIPLRMWIASSGQDADTLLDALEDDEKLRERLSKYSDAAGDEDSFELSSLSPYNKPTKGFKNVVDSGLMTEFVSTRGGKVHAIYNQREAENKFNDRIVKQVTDLNKNPDKRKNLAKQYRGKNNVF